MTKQELKAKLDGALKQFDENINLIAPDQYSKRPVAEGDLVEAMRQVDYVLSEFRNAILEYLS